MQQLQMTWGAVPSVLTAYLCSLDRFEFQTLYTISILQQSGAGFAQCYYLMDLVLLSRDLQLFSL